MIGTVDHIDYNGDRVLKVFLRFPDQIGANGKENIKEITTCERIGQGSFGTVYRAFSEEYPRLALKIATGKSSRLHEELTVLRKVCTRGRLLLPRFEFGALTKAADLIVVGMELCVPSTLHDLLLSTRLTSEADMLYLAHQATQAVGYVHEEGCIHRDVKLQNFVFDLDGNLKLIDFGLACNSLKPPAGDVVAGTVSFMSPEMAHNALHREKRISVGVAADVWSLGIVLFSIFTQRNPYPPLDPPPTSDEGTEPAPTAEEQRQLENTRLLQRVEAGDWRWPSGCTLSSELKQLLDAILVVNADRRPSVATILQHKLWERRRRYTPPALTAFLGVQDDLFLSHDEEHLMRAVEQRSAGVAASLMHSRQQSPANSEEGEAEEEERQRALGSLKVVQKDADPINGEFSVHVYDVRTSARKRAKPIREISQVIEETAKDSQRAGKPTRSQPNGTSASRASSTASGKSKASRKKQAKEAASVAKSAVESDSNTTLNSSDGHLSAKQNAAGSKEKEEDEGQQLKACTSTATESDATQILVRDEEPRLENTKERASSAEPRTLFGDRKRSRERSEDVVMQSNIIMHSKPSSRAASRSLLRQPSSSIGLRKPIVGTTASTSRPASVSPAPPPMKKVASTRSKTPTLRPAENTVSKRPQQALTGPVSCTPPAPTQPMPATHEAAKAPPKISTAAMYSKSSVSQVGHAPPPPPETTHAPTLAAKTTKEGQKQAAAAASLELRLSALVKEEHSARAFLRDVSMLEHKCFLDGLRLLVEEDQERYNTTWLAEEQLKSAAHPHVFGEVKKVSAKYEYGFVCDMCDYDFLPGGKDKKTLHFFHCRCGRDLCPDCYQEYLARCTCACCHRVHPNSCQLRDHLLEQKRKGISTTVLNRNVAANQPASTTKWKTSGVAALPHATPMPTIGLKGRKLAASKKASSPLTKSAQGPTSLPVHLKRRPTGSNRHGGRNSADVNLEDHYDDDEDDEEEEESTRGESMKMSVSVLHSREKSPKNHKTRLPAKFQAMEKLPDGPWRPFAGVRAERPHTTAQKPTPEEREQLLNGEWVRHCYLYPPNEEEEPFAFAFHSQPGRTGAVFITGDFPMQSAVLSMLERQLFVVDEIYNGDNEESVRVLPLVKAKGHPRYARCLRAMQDIGAYDTNMMKQQRAPGTISVYQAPRNAYSCNGDPYLFVRWFRFSEDGAITALLLSNGAVQVIVNNDYEVRWFDEDRKFLIRSNGVCELIDNNFAMLPVINSLLFGSFDE